MTRAAPSSTRTGRWGTISVVLLGIAALFAVLTPVALQVDARIDRTRPMYDDRARMEWLQYQTVLATGEARPVEVAAGESVELAGEEFTPSAGVVVEVRADGPDRPCVRTSNEHGDVSEWSCLDLDDPPADPDPEDVDLTVGQIS